MFALKKISGGFQLQSLLLLEGRYSQLENK